MMKHSDEGFYLSHEGGRKGRLAFVLLAVLAMAGCDMQDAPSSSLSTPAPGPAVDPAKPQTSEVQIDQAKFQQWLAEFRAEALRKGIRADVLDVALNGVQPIPRVLELDRKQPEFTMTFDEYLNKIVSSARITRGRAMMAANRDVLESVSRQYGVPPQNIAAMWGIESNFGQLTGGFQIVPALATLAFDGRRSGYFRGELLQALTIVNRGMAPMEKLKGSWAGAMGQCQFMPTTYMKYAVSWNGSGKPDIWAEPGDVFASTANYLSQIGWRKNETWGRAVRLPEGGLPGTLFGLDAAKRSQKDWAALGVTQADGTPLPMDDTQMSLIRAESGKNGDVGVGAPYLVGENFRVMMKWNRSTFFALAAGTLADRLASQ